MDADIINAPDMLTVEKLKAQDYRNSAISTSAANGTRQATYEQDVASMLLFRTNQMAVIQAEAAKLGPELTFRDRLVLAIADKYMTASTSTVPATYQADAALDAAKLKAGVDEIMKLWPA